MTDKHICMLKTDSTGYVKKGDLIPFQFFSFCFTLRVVARDDISISSVDLKFKLKPKKNLILTC